MRAPHTRFRGSPADLPSLAAWLDGTTSVSKAACRGWAENLPAIVLSIGKPSKGNAMDLVGKEPRQAGLKIEEAGSTEDRTNTARAHENGAPRWGYRKKKKKGGATQSMIGRLRWVVPRARLPSHSSRSCAFCAIGLFLFFLFLSSEVVNGTDLLFEAVGGTLCSFSVSGGSTTIVGNVALQGRIVAFDLGNKRLGIGYGANCDADPESLEVGDLSWKDVPPPPEPPLVPKVGVTAWFLA